MTPPNDQTATVGTSREFDLGSFVDSSGQPCTVDVNWGDASADTIFQATAGPLPAQIHAYASLGAHLATVTVTNVSGSSASGQFHVTIDQSNDNDGPDGDNDEDDNGSQQDIGISNVTASAANSEQTPFVFTITVSNPTNMPLVVSYATHDGTVHAAEGVYRPTSGSLTFGPGTTSQQITVLVNGGAAILASETFLVDLTTTSGTNVAEGVGTIEAPSSQGIADGITIGQPPLAPLPRGVPTGPSAPAALPMVFVIDQAAVLPALTAMQGGAGGDAGLGQPQPLPLMPLDSAKLASHASFELEQQQAGLLAYLSDGDQYPLLGMEPGDEIGWTAKRPRQPDDVPTTPIQLPARTGGRRLVDMGRVRVLGRRANDREKVAPAAPAPAKAARALARSQLVRGEPQSVVAAEAHAE